jgi:hypothetical protein
MRIPRIWLALSLTAVLAATPSLADTHCGPVPVIPSCKPQWTAITGVPGVQYAPNIASDLFRYRGGYYCQHGGRWFQAGTIQGPWSVVQTPPATFHRIQPVYFKTPPGWARGKKIGWGGAPMPPGQMKKSGCAPGHIPPGQLKKMAP